MRFHSRHPQPLYLSKKFQNRLLRLVGLLVLVMIAGKLVSRPNFWHWMFPQESAEGEQAETEKRPPRIPEIDFQVRLDDGRQLQQGEFLWPADPELLSQANNDDSGERGQSSLEIDARLLASVRDNTLNIRSDEREAYYMLLAKARDASVGDMERAADRDVSFAVLMHQPRYYRGKLITVRGEVKRLWPFSAGENAHGLKDLWEVWLISGDSGINPYRIVCTEIPPGIPQGEKFDEPVPVRVTGFFFKKQGYSSRGGLHTAPLLLARTLRWFPLQPSAETQDSLRAAPYIVGLVCLTAVVLVVTCWRLSARDRAYQRSQFQRYNEPSPEMFEALQAMETTDVSDLFRAMSEEVDDPEPASQPKSTDAADENPNAESDSPA